MLLAQVRLFYGILWYVSGVFGGFLVFFPHFLVIVYTFLFGLCEGSEVGILLLFSGGF